MKKGYVVICAILFAGFMATNLQANCGKCKGDAKKGAAAVSCAPHGCPMASIMDKLELDDEQKAAIAKARDECRKKIQAILTPDQAKKMKKLMKGPSKGSGKKKSSCKGNT